MPDPAPQDGAFATLPYRYDAIGINEAMNYLFKKSIGYPNTKPQSSLYSEFVQNYDSFSFISKNKLYNQTIPLSNLPLNTYILDPKFSNVNYTSPGINFINDLQSKRYYSSNYPWIAYYSNVLLTNIANDSSSASYTLQTVSYGHPLLVNAIPITFSPYPAPGNYTITLLTSNIGSQTVISPTDGYWLVDTDSGIVTIYDSNTTVQQLGVQLTAGGAITGYKLPRISFFRYEGLIGSTNVANTQDF